MKIETRVAAGAAGTVGNVHAVAGQQVSAKVLLAELVPQDAGVES